MFNLEAKAATLLGAYQGTAELIETLSVLEQQSDVPDEDVALAMAHLSRAMAALSAARSFCVDLCPSKGTDLDSDTDCGCFACITAGSEDALALAQQAGLEAVDEALSEEMIPILNRPSPDRPVRFNVDGVYVWARTRDEAEQILAETRAALGEEVKP